MRRAVACLGVAAALVGCGGGGGDAKHALDDTARNLGKIRSGVLHVELAVRPPGMGRGPIGFRLDGPFSLGSSSSPGVLRIAYTQLPATSNATVTIVEAGGRGYVETKGRAYELPPAQAVALQAATQQLDLSRFGIGDWIRDPKLSDGGRIAGAETDRITARLDVVRAANDLAALARAAGRQVPELEGANAKQLADAVQSSSFELYTGKKDRLLRRLRIEADFAFGPQTLRTVLGSLVGAKVKFVLGVDRPNSTVHVEPPAHALPASQLGY